MEKLLAKPISDAELVFYEKDTNFIHMNTIPIFGNNSGHYVLHLSQNEVLGNEIALASTDYSIQLIDIATL